MENSNQPIFIIGSPRSGTSLLRLILDSHTNISCGPESKFLPEMSQLICEKYWFAITDYGFDQAYWQQKNAKYFSDFQTEYAQKRGKKRWAEKTPAYSLNLDLINSLFPDCQFIHMIRDGNDVLASIIKRWGYLKGFQFLFKWKEYVEECQRFGASINPQRYIEIRYEELVNNPEVILKKLCQDFLHEPWQESLLKYQDFPHDGKGWDNFPDQSQDQDLKIYNSNIGLGKKELNPIMKAIFQMSSRDLLKHLGYQE